MLLSIVCWHFDLQIGLTEVTIKVPSKSDLLLTTAFDNIELIDPPSEKKYPFKVWNRLFNQY